MDCLNIAKESLKKYYGLDLKLDGSNCVDVCFDFLNASRVVFSKNVWEKLQNIMITTQVDTKEIGFLLVGKEFLPNQVYFNEVILSDAPLKSNVADFGKEITSFLKTMIEENLDVRTVIAHGHSHPNISEFYQNFSLSDLAGYVELTFSVEDFRLKNMQLVGCLVLPEGEVKFAYFNPDDNKFYAFESVEIETDEK